MILVRLSMITVSITTSSAIRCRTFVKDSMLTLIFLSFSNNQSEPLYNANTMGAGSSKSKKKQYLKIGSSKYKVISIESTNDVMTELVVSETKTKEEYLLKKMVINNGTNIDYLSEADVFSRLPSHPNIVRYVGSSHFVQQNGSIEFALLTENVSPWTNLQHLMEKQLLNDFKLKLKAFEDLCHAIQHCHTNNIAHLSIHPLNILQDGFGTFKLSNFASSIIMSNGLSTMQYSRNSIFSAMHVMDHHNEHKSQLNELRKTSSLHLDTHNNSIFIAPELLDPKQYTAVFDNKLFEKGDIWSLVCLYASMCVKLTLNILVKSLHFELSKMIKVMPTKKRECCCYIYYTMEQYQNGIRTNWAFAKQIAQCFWDQQLPILSKQT